MSRTVKISKTQLLAKIKANKEAHIVDYNEAVEAYKEEALKQLAELIEEAEAGDLEIELSLVTPIDNTEKYNEIIQLFEWEINDEVELTKNEFDEYVLDKSNFATHALYTNSTYKSF
jgi:HPt (histidine-containing phosphotransfer) domain-containing protein